MFKQIFLDMDGVIVDWDKGTLREFGLPHDAWAPDEWAIPYEEVFGCTREVFWFRLDRVAFWHELPRSEDFWRIMSILEPCKPIILSGCVVPAAYVGKVLWLEDNLPDVIKEKRYILCPTEAKQYISGPGKILIDDREATREVWEAGGGDFILYPRPWNSLKDVPYPLEYLMSQVMRLIGGK